MTKHTSSLASIEQSAGRNAAENAVSIERVWEQGHQQAKTDAFYRGKNRFGIILRFVKIIFESKSTEEQPHDDDAQV